MVLIRHGYDPLDDRVVTYFRSKNCEPEIIRPFAGEQMGALDDGVAASVVYGGGFNVFETDAHPFLLDEHRWIEQCIDHATTVQVAFLWRHVLVSDLVEDMAEECVLRVK